MRLRVWTLVVLFAATTGYARFLSDVHPVPLRKPLSSVPQAFGAWTGRSDAMDTNTLRVVGVEDYLMREYQDGAGTPVSVYVGFYEQQREGDQIHSPKHCLPGSGWNPTRSDVVQFDTPGFNGGLTRANRYVIGKGEERQLVLYWYQSAGRDITSEYLAKVYLVADSILRKRNDGALIRFMAPLRTEAELDAAQEKVVGFARLILPRVGEVLPE